MNQIEMLDQIKERLVTTYAPLEIYLFGSQAWGAPTSESDIDLLVVVAVSNEPKRYKRSLPGYKALFGLRVGNDLMVYTKNEFDVYSEDKTSLVYRIKTQGKKIYAKS